MHPVITQAIAEDRAREFQAHAAAARRARQHGRSVHARLLTRFSRRGPARAAAAWPMRGPRAA